MVASHYLLGKRRGRRERQRGRGAGPKGTVEGVRKKGRKRRGGN